MPSRKGQKGTAAAYNLKDVRACERAITEQAEQAYRKLVADWQQKTPSKPGVAAANGARLQGSQRGKLRGRRKPQILLFAQGSTTPPHQPRRLLMPARQGGVRGLRGEVRLLSARWFSSRGRP